jgi:hypothetical protein
MPDQVLKLLAKTPAENKILELFAENSFFAPFIFHFVLHRLKSNGLINGDSKISSDNSLFLFLFFVNQWPKKGLRLGQSGARASQ